MVNSIKFILEKRNMQQKELIYEHPQENEDKLIKQTISKYINRQRKISKFAVAYFEKKLRVPSRFFRGDDGYCKLLTETEISELEEYLLLLPYREDEYEMQESIGLAFLEQKFSLDRAIKRFQKEQLADIYDSGNVESKEQYLNDVANKLSFYEKMLRLHKNSRISSDEWHYFLMALSCLADNATELEVSEKPELVRDIVNAVQKYRKKRQEIIELFVITSGEDEE